VPLQPKPADLLACLLEASGQLVSREVLGRVLYPDVKVSEHALRNIVLKLREALGPEHQDWVETVPRRGLRFVGPVSAQPSAPGEASPHHLLAERDTFHGRAAEAEALTETLGRARLVTLLGPGGAGKTRLAQHHAWASLQRWPAGAWFCDLSDARSVDVVAAIVAQALEVPLGRAEPVAQLGQALATRGPCLLVLDNFEQLVGLAAQIAGAWLDRAPELRILTTSRVRLGLPGEHVLDVGPLEADAAAALFVDRARAADPRFLAQPDDPELASLVSMLDGLPLALELAAARTRTMSLSDLHARMGRRFELLRAGGGRPERHLSLRGALDGSWEGLSEEEQAALAQLSVFEGGFSLRAAEAVLTGPFPAELVQELVDKSLVRALVREPRRFELLVTVREYAVERRAAPAELAAAERRHGAFFADHGLAALAGPDPDRALEPELANLMAACRRAAARGDLACAAATMRGASVVLDVRGPPRLALELAEAVTRLPPGPETHPVALILGDLQTQVGQVTEGLALLQAAASQSEGLERARARKVLGACLMQVGRLDEAEVELQAALAQLRGDRGEAALWLFLGNLARLRGQIEQARARYEQAVVLARQVQDGRIEGFGLAALAVVYHGLGQGAEARRRYEEAIEAARTRGDLRIEGQTQGNLGALHHDEGRLEEAERCYLAALALHRRTSNRREEGNVLGNLGNWSLSRGRPDEAQARYEEALAIHREVGNRREEGIALSNLGVLCQTRGELGRAWACYEEALAIHREVGNRRFEAGTLAKLAVLHRPAEPVLAAERLREALALQREIGNAPDLASTLSELATTALVLGDLESASQAARDAVELLRGLGHRGRLAEGLKVAAQVEQAAGRPQEARARLAEASRLLEPE
jgi:predicted ATPase/tetratricopeptide (TPR) repeat protein/DNA-binding winged helix-turn-helix (wHTH) protein